MSACRGTCSRPPNAAAASVRVDSASRTRFTPEARRAGGSSKATWPSRPRPSTARSIGASSSAAACRAASAGRSGAAPSSVRSARSGIPSSRSRSAAAKLAGSAAPSPAYSSSWSTVADAERRCPAAACARSAAYMPAGVRPVGSSSAEPRAGRQAVGDDLRGDEADAVRVGQHEGRRRLLGAVWEASRHACIVPVSRPARHQARPVGVAALPNQDCAPHPMAGGRGSRSMGACD